MSRKINYFDDDDDFLPAPAPSIHSDINSENLEPTLKVIRQKRKELRENPNADKTKTEMALDTLKKILGGILALIGIIAHSVSKWVRNREHRGLQFILFLISTILILAIFVGGVTLSFHNHNKENIKFNKDAGSVCANYIKEHGVCSYENLWSAYGIEGYRMTGLCYARQMDFDGDSHDELLLCFSEGGEYTVEVWGYNKDKKFACLYTAVANKPSKKSMDSWITIYHEGNKYFMCEHSSKDVSKVTIHQLKGDVFENKNTCVYDKTRETFLIKNKEYPDRFERIKLSVINEKKAITTTNLITDTIDDFTSENGISSNQLYTDKSLQRAYHDIVQEHIKVYGEPTIKSEDGYTYIDGLAYVKQMDFNGDGTNELVVIYRKPVKIREEDRSGNYIAVTTDRYYCEIYKYNGKNAVMVYQKDNVSNMRDDRKAYYTIFKKAKTKTQLCTNYFTSENYGRVVTAKSNTLSFDGERFVSKKKASYYTSYGYTDYYINGNSVYSSSFKEKGGYDVPFFDGEKHYDASKFDIIYLQQKKKDAVDMTAQLNDTKSEINKLKA